jgi:hypothetical protein
VRISPQMLQDRVTVLAPVEGEDTYGNVVLTHAPSRTISALVVPAEGTEGQDGRQAVVRLYDLYTSEALPGGALSRVKWQREVYEVIAPPRNYHGGCVASLRRVEG